MTDTNAGLLRRLHTDMDACGYSHYEMLGACGREDDSRSAEVEYSAYATQPTAEPAQAHAPQPSSSGLVWYAAAAAAAVVAFIALPSVLHKKSGVVGR